MSASFLQAIVEWDGEKIAGGKPGPVAIALEELLWLDMKGGAQAMIDNCTIGVDPTVVANAAEASEPQLAASQHVTDIPALAYALAKI